MGLILWIDENTFSTSLLEKVFKQKGFSFYTLESAIDFSFLVDDLNPEIIVLDIDTALKNKDAFLGQIEKNSKLKTIPFIFIGESNEFNFLNKKGEISRPYDPFEVPKMILEINKTV